VSWCLCAFGFCVGVVSLVVTVFCLCSWLWVASFNSQVQVGAMFGRVDCGCESMLNLSCPANLAFIFLREGSLKSLSIYYVRRPGSIV
jgi:hypothetical protein